MALIRRPPGSLGIALVTIVFSATAQPIAGDPSAGIPEAGALSLGGALAGASASPSSGVLRAALGLSFPAGRGGMGPGLDLTYNSTSGIREAGIGWGLSLPVIERGIRRGPPGLDDATLRGDEMSFNGQRLVPMCEIGSATAGCDADLGPFPGWVVPGTRYYRLEQDASHARFFWLPSRTTWRVQLPGGETLELGRPMSVGLLGEDAAVDADASVDHDEELEVVAGTPPRLAPKRRAAFRWNLARRYMPSAAGLPVNVVAYRWSRIGATGRGYLTDVYYSPRVEPRTARGATSYGTSGFAHHVHLAWTLIPQAGNRVTPVWRAVPDHTLSRVDVASKPYGDHTKPRELVRRYHLAYRGNQRAYLQSVQLEGRCAAPVAEVGERLPTTSCARQPATTFNWSPLEGNTTARSVAPASGFPATVPNDWHLVPLDVDADGLPDLVEANPGFQLDPNANAESFGALKLVSRRAYLQRGGLLQESTIDAPAGLLANAALSVTGDFASTGQTSAVLFAQAQTRDCGPGAHGPCGPPFIAVFGTLFHVEELGTTTGQRRFAFERDAGVGAGRLGHRIYDYEAEAVGDVNGDSVPDLVDLHADAEDNQPDDKALVRVRYGQRMPWSANDGTYTRVTQSCVGPSRNAMLRSDWGLGARLPVSLADMNGDGLTDVVLVGPQKVEYWPGDGRGNFTACRGAGCTCSEGAAEAPSASMFTPALGQITSSKGWRLADVNGDGYSDLIVVVDEGVRVYPNVDGFTFGNPIAIAGVSLFGAEWAAIRGDADRLKLAFADMNGNGVTDLVLQAGKTIQTVDLHRLASPAPGLAPDAFGPRPGLLVGIDNGLGASTSIAYVTTAQLADRAQGLGKPWLERIPQVMPLVSRLTTRTTLPGSQPDRVDYDYDDPAWDGFDRVFRGFRESTAARAGSTTVSTRTRFFVPPCPLRKCWSTDPTFALQRAASGVPVVTETFDNQGRYLSTVSQAYQVREEVNTSTSTAARFAYASRTDTRLYDTTNWTPITGAGETDIRAGDRPPLWRERVPVRSSASVLLRRTQRLDRHGNVTESVGHGQIRDDGSRVDDPIVTTLEYDPPRPDWRFLLRATDTAAFPARPRVPADHERKRTFRHDAAGRLTEVHAYLTGTVPLARRHEANAPVAAPPAGASQNGVWVRLARYGHDAFDNVTRIEGPSGICKDVRYDPAYAELVERTTEYRDGCGAGAVAVVQAWDRGLALPTAITSPGGARTVAAYDGFGRPSAVFLPDAATGQTQGNASTELHYDDVAGGPVQRVRRVEAEGSGETRTRWTYADGLGRLVLTLEQADPAAGDAGGWIAAGLPERGVGNRITATRLPWFYDGDPAAHPLVAPGGASMKLVRDSFERVVERRHLDGSLVDRHVHRPLLLEVQDAAGRVSSTRTDGHGRSVEWRGAGQAGQALRTTTAFLVGGEPARVDVEGTDGTRAGRWRQHDSLGRMVLNAEPNTAEGYVDDPAAAAGMRAWRYAYDDAGRLVGTSDARGCGQNVYHDGLGRLRAEDFSPCLSHHAAYSPPDLATGAGTESFHVYDAPEPGQTGDFGVSPQNLLGRLVAKIDLASHTRYAYDWRGQQVARARRMARPSDAAGLWPAGTLPADRFGGDWFRNATRYDERGRIASFTTGAASPELVDAAGRSEIAVQYSRRGLPVSVSGSYGTLVEQATYEVDDQPATVRYGDTARSLHQFTYDINRRPKTRTLSRVDALLWTAGAPGYAPPAATDPPTRQLLLASFGYQYGPTGALERVDDDRVAGEWPAGAKPTDLAFSYGPLGRLARTDYQRAAPDTLVSFSPAGTSLPGATLASRVGQQTFSFDALGNVTSSTDDLGAIFDRSLGVQTHGTAGSGPHQLRSAANGAVDVRYDAAGNVGKLVIARPGPCADAAGRCSHHLQYDWDELGRLARARRWDTAQATTPPAGRADAEARFRYGSNGERMIASTVAADDTQTHVVDVFDTLRLEGARYVSATAGYERTAATEVVAIPGIGRVMHRPGLPRVGNSDRHVFLQVDDHLTSTIAVIDHATSELVERTTYQAFGLSDSVYRTPRWQHLGAHQRYGGKVDDAAFGLFYFGARYYQAHLGRWLSADPLTVHSGGGDLNAYAFVSGVPSFAMDPDGLQSWCPGPYCGSPVIGMGESGRFKSSWINAHGGPSSIATPSLPTNAVAPSAKPAAPAPAPQQKPHWTGAMRYAVRLGPIGFGVGMVLDPGKTLATVVIDTAETLVGYIGPENTTSRASEPGVPAEAGEASLTDTEALVAITAQEIIGAGTGALLSRALSGIASVEARAAATEFCPGGLCLFDGQCFVAGTPVWTPSGPRPIESLRVGDLVLSRDEETGEARAQRVTRTFVTPDREVVHLRVVSGAREESLHVTGEHPFHVPGRGWVPASGLEQGSRVSTAEGEVTVAQVEAVAGRQTVYNMEVEDTHTYFVGRLGSWVHNHCPTVFGSKIGPGMYAHPNGWIPLSSPAPRFTMMQRLHMNIMGSLYGCHTCGTYNPGTTSGNWIIDHQIARAFWTPGMPLRGYPQCATCGLVRGGAESQPHQILRYIRLTQ